MARLLLAVATMVALAAGIWVTGGLITNDFVASLILTAAWMAVAGLACLVLTFRHRRLGLPLLGGYAVVAVVAGVWLGRAELFDKTVNEILYSGTFRHLAEADRRSEPSRLWNTDANLIPLEQARAPHEAETLLPVREHGTANALALWFSADIAPGLSLSL